jgi:3-oxoacyl-[acyl-carrier protein] reductase
VASPDLQFEGRVAIVTGAAHGIGRAIAGELAEHGATVYASDVLESELRDSAAAAAAAAAAAGGACEAVVADVTDEDQVGALIAAGERIHGAIDILVNVAGGVRGQVGRALEDVSRASWQDIVDVNLTGAFLSARAVAPGMKRQRYGRIVSISSGAGRSTSLTGIQAYAASKAGQIGLTRQLAHELGPWGITSNSVAPGFVLSNPATRKQWESYGEDGQRGLVESLALRRLGTPEDIAGAVLFFASDLAGWCTGQILSVDGGRQMF